jgi:hypothetical protein
MSNLKQQQEQIAQLKAQIEQLKAAGAGMFSSWTSDKGNTFLSFKPSRGRSVLMSRTAVEELLAHAETARKALNDFGVN